MKNDDAIKYFQKVKVEKPSDVILRQIRELITRGVFKPGDRLPSENKLAEAFSVKRHDVRDALKILEFYGVLVTKPQVGTFVAKIGIHALEGLISNIISIDILNIHSLIDTRSVLEIHAAELAAKNCTEEEINKIVDAYNMLEACIEKGQRGLDEDLHLHLRIANYSHSPVLSSLITLITPAVVRIVREFDDLNSGSSITAKTLEYHKLLVEGVKERDIKKAKNSMKKHMHEVKSLVDKIDVENYRIIEKSLSIGF